MDRETLEHKQIPIYLAAVVLAAIVGLMAPAAAQELSPLITPSIAILMYAMFLQIPFLDLHAGLKNKRFMGALFTANFVAVPLLVWGLSRGLLDHPAIMVGALLVLLTPCIDYVVVFTHIGKGNAKLILAATPILLLLQLVLLPLYLAFMLAESSGVVISIGPFAEAFLLLIVLPLALAVLTAAGAKSSRTIERWNNAWAWMPVPAMTGVLLVVIASQISPVVQDFDRLLPVIPVYLAFMLLAPILGAVVARAFGLDAHSARSVVFSSATRNSLVVLPLALALPEDIRGLAAAAVITQTLIELVCELIYIRLVPLFIRSRRMSVGA